MFLSLVILPMPDLTRFSFFSLPITVLWILQFENFLLLVSRLVEQMIFFIIKLLSCLLPSVGLCTKLGRRPCWISRRGEMGQSAVVAALALAYTPKRAI